MARSLIILGSIVFAAGVILGACLGAAVFRAATYYNPDLVRIPSGIQSEFGIAIAAFFVTLGEAQALAKFLAVSGKVLWVSALISIVIAVPVALVGVAGELDTFPPETARLVVISVVFALVGLSVGAGFVKRPY